MKDVKYNTFMSSSYPDVTVSITYIELKVNSNRATSNQLNYKHYQKQIHITHHTHSLKSLIHPLKHFHSSHTVANNTSAPSKDNPSYSRKQLRNDCGYCETNFDQTWPGKMWGD